MASKETLGRVRHVELASQQHRLRHLRSISARNIVTKFPLDGDTLAGSLLETYFSLHKDDKSKAIYTSEKIAYSLNPTWSSFEPSTWSETLETASTTFVVRVWGGQGNRFQLLIEWKVNLPALRYLGDQIRSSQHSPNTLLFGLVDGYYGSHRDDLALKQTSSNFPNTALKVDLDQVVSCYNRSSLLRLCTLQKAIRQTQISVQEVRHSIEDKIQFTEKSMLQVSECESLNLRVKLLREELISKQDVQRKEQEEEQKFLERLRKRERNLERKREELERQKTVLREHKRAYIDKREALVKLNAQLSMRKRQLAAELTHIYPIIELPTKETLICGIRLPNSESEEFYATDDETLSCSLGYACHLVYMVSKIMELPLRYAMSPMGSRSTIVDFTIDKVTDKEKEFPLHTKGKEKIQFYYGVFLLNKNVAQLRQSCGLGTPNLRNTLPNIRDLLATKFRASATPNSLIESVTVRGTSNAKSTSSNSSLDSGPRNSRIVDELLNNEHTQVSTKQGETPSVSKPPLPPKPTEDAVTAHGTKNTLAFENNSTEIVKEVNESKSAVNSPSKGRSDGKPPLPPKPKNVGSRENSPKKSLPSRESSPKKDISSFVNKEQDENLENSNCMTEDKFRRRSVPIGSLSREHDSIAIQEKPRSVTDLSVPSHQSATHKFLEQRTKKTSKVKSAAPPSKKRVTRAELPVEVLRQRAAANQANDGRPCNREISRDGVKLAHAAGNVHEPTGTLQSTCTTCNPTLESYEYSCDSLAYDSSKKSTGKPSDSLEYCDTDRSMNNSDLWDIRNEEVDLR